MLLFGFLGVIFLFGMAGAVVESFQNPNK